MNELQKEINEAFIMISSIPVTEDSVDRMAMARGHLRRAYKLATPELEQSGQKETGFDG